ncbi:SRPBCC family protein [Flavobacterium sp.]|uniref:SRPBCC family protein n=1 Tax=Flavobacterium sp. TaxID=239 RepID=UPI00391C6432
MTTIRLITKINAPIQTVFDLARNIDVHQQSMVQSNEKAIAGRTSGLIELGETVTFRGKHFGFYLKHQSQITEMESPNYFVDEMIKGQFKYFRHEHTFVTQNGHTAMIDFLQYKVPFGIVGKLFNKILLRKHLENLLSKRNRILKNLAENQD